jgi:hypothetical protein
MITVAVQYQLSFYRYQQYRLQLFSNVGDSGKNFLILSATVILQKLFLTKQKPLLNSF